MASSQQLKLLGAWPSPFTIRAKVAFNIKSVTYEYQEEDVPFGKSELLLKSNPVYKKIPVLLHGGKPICESLIIVQYIDELWASGPSILPSDPYDRAIARFWATFIDTKWFPNVWGTYATAEPQAKAAAIEEVSQGLALLEDEFIKISKGKTFFGGEKIGYLDIALGSFLHWVRVIEIREKIGWINEAKTPNLFKWSQNFSADAAVKDELPETGKMAAFAEELLAKISGH